jgi:hypothetical protein
MRINKKEMNIDNKLDVLKGIKKVDAPPFLLTRVKQQIHNLSSAEAPVKWKWAFALTSIIIMMLNVTIFLKSNVTLPKKTSGVENVINGMNLSTKNDLYNE